MATQSDSDKELAAANARELVARFGVQTKAQAEAQAKARADARTATAETVPVEKNKLF